MRNRLPAAVIIATVAFALAACSGGGGSSGTTANRSSTPAGSTPVASSPAPTKGNGGGAVDCSALTKDDLAAYLVDTQLLGQVRDQTSVQALRDHTLGSYDPSAFAAILTKLQVLAGHSAAGFGDPADSIAFFTKANDIVGRMVASTGDVPQSLFDEYTAAVGNASAVISKQLPINAALSEYCPNTK